MKRNLIIFLFTLLLGGITCCNYSYASTVNVSESFCKNVIKNNIQRELRSEISSFNQANWWWSEMQDIQNAQLDSMVQDTIDNMSQEQQKTTCESNGCLYFHDKCVACPWIRLNTDIPFIWNCIPTDSQSEIFPVFIGWLIKFATSLLLLVGFIVIIISGVMIASGDDESVRKGKEWIRTVVKAMALLWASWVILKMINPNFFN